MAKSDHGLPPRSGATQQLISRELYDLRCALAHRDITFLEYERKFKALKKQGKA